jgi:hypothetical protein
MSPERSNPSRDLHVRHAGQGPWRGVAATAVLALAAAAASTALGQKIGGERWTSASGTGDGSAHELSTTAATYGLRSVTLWQYTHRPCALGADEAALRGEGVLSLEPLQACDPTNGQEWKRADVGAGHFVTGIATCRGKSKDRAIHGLQLWAATLEPSGRLVHVREPVVIHFRECSSWQPKRECPSGSVATGIRGYWSDADHGMEGLALKCHQVETIAANGTRHAG